MKKTIRGISSLIMAGGAAVIPWIATPVLAQTAAPANPKAEPGLEEIIVTAQRRETNLQQTPIAVTAVSGATLSQRGSVTIADLAVFTPSLTIGSNSGAGATGASISIRGMGVGALDSSAAVGVYVDNVYAPSLFGNLLGLLDVERVEVLRGPQGTLFGRNTIGGAIQYVSVKPAKDFGGFVEGTVGNLNRQKVTGALNVPIADTLAIRLSGLYDKQGGFVTDDMTGEKEGRTESTLGRAQLRWTPTSALTVDLKAEYARQRDNGRPVAIPAVNPNAQLAGLAFLFGETRPLDNRYVTTRKYHFAGFNSPDYFKSDEYNYVGAISYQLSDKVTLKSISAYVDDTNHLVTDLDLTPLSIAAVDRGIYYDKVFTQELQVSGKTLSNRLKFTVGAYYYDGKNTQPGSSVTLGFAPPMPLDGTQLKSKSISAYGQATYNITDALSVAVGLRYTHEKVTGSDTTISQAQSTTFHDLSPHFGLNYQATDDVLFYAKASKGFRAGGFTINSALLNRTDGGTPGVAAAYNPETAWTYEAGARSEFFDHRLRINPTVFYTNWKNIQFQRNIPAPPTIVAATENAGNAHLYGAELETQFAATPRLTFTASGSYLHAKYTRIASFILNTYPFGFLAALGGVPGSVVPVIDLTTNSPLQEAPKFKYSLGARYTLPLGGASKLTSSLDWGYTSHFRIGVTDSAGLNIPGYGLLNGRVQYDLPGGRLSVAVFATNLLNQYYYTGGAGFAEAYTVGIDEYDVGRPREVGGSVSLRF